MSQKTRPPDRAGRITERTLADGRTARFRARRLALATGETLVLHGDGTIERRDATGTTVERWPETDPVWAAHAIRFGLHASSTTIAPTGRDVPGSKPPA
jgi:hypothetical protein